MLETISIFWTMVGPIHSTKYPLEFIGDAEMPNAPISMKIFPRIWDTLRIMVGTANLASLRAAEAVLEQDGILAIFPRGACSQASAWHAASRRRLYGAASGRPDPADRHLQRRQLGHPTCEANAVKLAWFRASASLFGLLAIGGFRSCPRAEVKAAGQVIMEKIAEMLPVAARGPYTTGIV